MTLYVNRISENPSFDRRLGHLTLIQTPRNIQVRRR